jgi:hypothetical protein
MTFDHFTIEAALFSEASVARHWKIGLPPPALPAPMVSIRE